MDYEAEFNCLVKFVPQEVRNSERTKIQRFRDGLNLELQHDVQGFEIDTLGALVQKAKSMEEIRGKIKAQSEPQKSGLGKRSFGAYESRQFEAGSSLGPSKKQEFDKTQGQGQSSYGRRFDISGRPRCDK